jgi:hypothetical protein
MKENSGRFKKGMTSWIKGKKIDRSLYPNFGHINPHSEETKEKMRLKKIGKHSSIKTEFKEKIGFISYSALHAWVYRKLGKAKKCSNGHIANIYYWANISGEYKRDVSDWHELCPTCNKTDGIKINQRFYV